jgi:MFS family permease
VSLSQKQDRACYSVGWSSGWLMNELPRCQPMWNHSPMGLIGGAWRSAVGRRRLLVTTVVIVTGMVVLALWAPPSAWRWVREHLLTVGVAGLLIGLAGLIVPFLMRRLERRDAAAARHRARDRAVMLKRIRNRWIKGVLDQSLTEEARIRLGLRRRPEVIAPPAMLIRRSGQAAEPLPTGTPISEVFAEISGGLLILGAPGSGKTTALLELARDLLEDTEVDQSQPMPVVFNLSSWAARRSSLAEWLIDELYTRYDVARQIATQWVTSGEILPLLDGLDEVIKAHRADCVEAINYFQIEHGPIRLVVCSRTTEYTEAVRQLRVEEAVELQLPTREQVSAYLAAAGDALVDVQAALEADATLWEFLQSPLVLNIVALTYQGRSADALRSTGTAEQRLALLFAAYIKRMFEHRRGRYDPARMLHCLAWLAWSMRRRSQSEFHLDRLQPDWLPTKAEQRLATLAPIISAGLSVGLVLGLVTGLLGGAVLGLVVGLVAGLALAFGLAFGLIGQLTESRQFEEFRWIRRPELGLPYVRVEEVYWSWDLRHVLVGALTGAQRGGLLGMLGFGLFLGLISWLSGELSFELPGGLGLAGVLISRLVGGVVSGLGDVLVGVLAFGLVSALVGALIGAVDFALVNGLTDERSTPNEGVRRSARHAWVYGLPFGLAVGLADGLIVGLGVGLTAALSYGGLACLQHLVIRGLLVGNGLAPLRYVAFLDEAKDRLFLRRIGSGYIFVHRLLLEHFADLDTTRPPARAQQPAILAE